MRTTITLDPDTRHLIERAMRERGIGFKEAVNDAIRAGLVGRPAERPTQPVSLGEPTIDITRSLAIAAQLEDDELVRRLARGG